MTAKRILAVALKQFSEKGYDATSLAEIAGEVGIKKPSIYAHYKSKYDLFLAVVEDVAEEYREFRQELVLNTERMSFEKCLYSIFQATITYFVQDRIRMAFWVRVWMFPPAEARETILVPWQNLNLAFIDVIAEIFEQGMAHGEVTSGNAKDMAHTYLCLLDGFLTRVIISNDANYAQLLPQVWNCFWSGAKA